MGARGDYFSFVFRGRLVIFGAKHEMKCTINVVLCLCGGRQKKQKRKNRCEVYICQKCLRCLVFFRRAKHQKATSGKYDMYAGLGKGSNRSSVRSGCNTYYRQLLVYIDMLVDECCGSVL